MKRECGTAKIDEYTLVKTLEKLVKSQQQELELAVLDKGEYQLRPEFRHLVVTGEKWAKMTNDQRKQALSCVHHISFEEASCNNVASVNEKLVGDESVIFRQILFAGVDWITADVLKLIANKGEKLAKEGKVTELPATSAYDTLIIPSESKPTKPHIIVMYANGKVECQDCQGYSASSLCAHAVAASLKRATLEAYTKWLVANKGKTGGLNYSKAITFGMPAGRGRKGERQPRSRRGKQATSVVVPRNPLPSEASIGANEFENYLGGEKLHELYPASCQPSIATPQAQLSPLYPSVCNPPSFSYHGVRFHQPYASTFQAQIPQARFQAALPYRPLSIPPLATAGAWHSGLSPHFYHIVALPKSAKKCYGCGEHFSEKFRQPPHNLVVKHFDRRVVRRDESTGALVHSADFANTYHHSCPAHIKRKNPVFDGRVHIDLTTYHSLNESQKQILKALELIIDIVNTQ